MSRKIDLLPYRFRYYGVALTIAGMALFAGFMWFDFRITVPVFAILSSFLETRAFTITTTNLTDELLMVALLCGFFFLIFSEEKDEKRRYSVFRLKAWMGAFAVNTALLLFAMLFFYGTAFITILAINLYSTAIVYLLIFNRLLRKERAEKKP